jgi:signal transduction histidine kinase
VALKREGERVLLVEQPFAAGAQPPIRTYDYRGADAMRQAAFAFETLLAPRGRALRVLARPRFESAEFVEIVLDEAPLKRAMARYTLQAAVGATLVALAAGAIVYLVLRAAFVRPVRRLTAAIERFRDHPEDASNAFPRSSRADEIGRAQKAAAEMAEQVRAALRQRERLATLGGAVARIAHDLRNMLTTAQMVSERLATSDDPKVRQLAPRLEHAIGRAAGLASSTARFGRADEEAAVLKPVRLREAVKEAALDALVGFERVCFVCEAPAGLVAIADDEYVHRILTNLLRNAAQALSLSEDARIIVRGGMAQGACVLEIEDNGPGVAAAVLPHLFEPFAAPTRGAGLGLAIARELARALSGEVTLTRNGADGATFEVRLPAA